MEQKMNIRTFNHAGGFTYVTMGDIGSTYGNEILMEFARWLQSKPCPIVKGVHAAYYTDFVEFMNARK